VDDESGGVADGVGARGAGGRCGMVGALKEGRGGG